MKSSPMEMKFPETPADRYYYVCVAGEISTIICSCFHSFFPSTTIPGRPYMLGLPWEWRNSSEGDSALSLRSWNPSGETTSNKQPHYRGVCALAEAHPPP